MRSFMFNLFFYSGTFIYAIVCAVLSLLPGRGVMMASLRRYTKVMQWGMRHIAGIQLTVTGHSHVPTDGPVIIAAKHQSYGDGIVMFSQFDDLSFVTGDHLEKFWLLKRILGKMNAVVIDNCGGVDAREKMAATSAIVREQGRRILIYPEGHLSQVGTHHRYRKGVYHLYADFNCPVVPVATNLGQRWNQMDWTKHPGPASVEFLEPIAPGMEKEAFMALLEERIESRSLDMLDRENLGALTLDDIGKRSENESARAKRIARENQDSNETPEQKS